MSTALTATLAPRIVFIAVVRRGAGWRTHRQRHVPEPAGARREEKRLQLVQPQKAARANRGDDPKSRQDLRQHSSARHEQRRDDGYNSRPLRIARHTSLVLPYIVAPPRVSNDTEQILS